ncbi:MAG: holo-ACP synthase [Actinomycetota bacterium]|nr:holo-ACP synthase [Actinomycetota bacterium]
MIGIGVDLVEVERFRKVLLRTPNIVSRLFRPSEREYAEKAGDPAERYAGRFAVKEATLKSLGLGLGAMPMYDIEVVRESSGQPTLFLHGKAFTRSEEAGVTRWELSITHTDHLAFATVVAL